MTQATLQPKLITPVLLAGSAVLLVSFAIRATFGLFQIPVADEFGWPRAEFSMAIAIQNLAWGFGQPIFAAIAEKYGDRFAIVMGAFLYAVGLAVSSLAVTPESHFLLQVFVGFGIAGTGFGVILAVVGRASSDENRSMALGITTSAGSAGQVVGPPIAATLLQVMPWQSVFLVFSVVILAILVVLPVLRPSTAAAEAVRASREKGVDESLGVVLNRAMRDPSYILIFFGFFSCGYQLGFITAHFPAFIEEVCAAIPPDSLIRQLGADSTKDLGGYAIAVIGATNIAGTLLAGWLGKSYSKKYLLAAIYVARTIIAAWFILTPMTLFSVLVFSTVMGSLWLATVPLTSGLVAQIFGLKYMGTLYGIVFLSHQLGAFLGVWLGGALYDVYGSYDVVWWVGVGVGALSAIVHLPVNETARGLKPVAV
ncbi:MAG: MFS transporter [Alphaproteobacteria bacterium]